MSNQEDELIEKIHEEEREDVEQDMAEVEGETEHIPRPSEDGDADLDLDERGGNQENHETR